MVTGNYSHPVRSGSQDVCESAAFLERGMRSTGTIYARKFGPKSASCAAPPPSSCGPPSAFITRAPGPFSKPDRPPRRLPAVSPAARWPQPACRQRLRLSRRTRVAAVAALASPHARVGRSVLQTDGGCAASRAANMERSRSLAASPCLRQIVCRPVRTRP